MFLIEPPMLSGNGVGRLYCAPTSRALVCPDNTGVLPQTPLQAKRSIKNLYDTPILSRFPTGVPYDAMSK